MMKMETVDARRERSGGEQSKNSVASRWSEAVWLGGKEIRWSWLSYPATGLVMLLLGVLIVPSVDGILSPEGSGQDGEGFESGYAAFFPDFLFLTFGMLLTVNWLSREYLQVHTQDTFSERLVFLRSFPISPETIVGSRMLSLCFTLLFTVPAFFAPVYLITDLGQLGSSFLWFVLIWVGYSLLGAGLWLLMEFGMRGKTYLILSFASVPLLIATVALLEWSVQLRAVERFAGLAQSHGPLAATISIIVGAIGFVVMARAATRLIENRDLSP